MSYYSYHIYYIRYVVERERCVAPVLSPTSDFDICVCLCSEKVYGVHQLPSPAGDEKRKIRPGLQTVPEDDPSGKSQVGYPGQQLPSSQVY